MKTTWSWWFVTVQFIDLFQNTRIAKENRAVPERSVEHSKPNRRLMTCNVIYLETLKNRHGNIHFTTNANVRLSTHKHFAALPISKLFILVLVPPYQNMK